MRAYQIGRWPGIAAPEALEAPACLRHAGAASVPADAVSPVGLNQKESAPAAQGTQGREQNEHPNCAATAGAYKAFHTLRAHLPLTGYSLSRAHGDDEPVCFHVNRWGMVHELRDFTAVLAFAKQVGASHA